MMAADRVDNGASPDGQGNGASPDGQGRSYAGDLSWLLNDLVARVRDIDKAVILTRDGLVTGASQGLSREDAEHLAAVAAGVQSLARGAGRHFGGGRVRQTIVEMEDAFLFVTAAGEGSCLAVLTPAAADVGLVAYEMAVMVKRVGPHLEVDPRPGSGGGLGE
jgi:predicted regulator of Ras-like GTPase activity (Roadblock/LC7/MglB family)